MNVSVTETIYLDRSAPDLRAADSFSIDAARGMADRAEEHAQSLRTIAARAEDLREQAAILGDVYSHSIKVDASGRRFDIRVSASDDA